MSKGSPRVEEKGKIKDRKGKGLEGEPAIKKRKNRKSEEKQESEGGP